MVGRTVTHYHILEKLGEGGMGVVYRARDHNLNRRVAVKFLSTGIADEVRRRRFQQEAQTASSLNHPHILPVYEAGSEDGQQYLVTEFVDGGTLRDWMKREKPSVRQIVELVTGIADALACAHEAGIVHRDIKPENVLVSKQGHARLADFGLAKLTEELGPGTDGETRTLPPVTLVGSVVGTVPYMSPEQVSGGRLDARSDIFSFAAMLYELIAGERPFRGKTDQEVARAILSSPPQPLSEARPDIPWELRAIVEKGIEKEPAERYQSMRELVVDLKRVQRQRSGEHVLDVVSRPHPWRLLSAVTAAVMVSAVALAWWLYRVDFFWKNPLANAHFTRFTDFEGSELDAAISPDGKLVAFLSDRAGVFDLWLGQSGRGEFVNLTKGRFPEMFFWEIRNVGFTADGSELWFRTALAGTSTGGLVRRIPVIGGADRPFLDQGLNPVWSPDGQWLAYHEPTRGDPIFVADRSGRSARKIFAGGPGIHAHFQTWSPDGRLIYFVSGYPPDEMDIWRVPAAGGQAERLTHHNADVAYPVFVDRRTLIYRATAEDGSGFWLYGMDVNHRIPHRVSFGVEQYLSVSASADGKHLAATVSNPTGSLWTVPLSGATAGESDATPFVLPNVRAVHPRFGPDYIVYLSSRSGADGLFRFSNGTVMELFGATEGRIIAAPAVSLDGRRLCFATREKRSKLYVMNADGTGLHEFAEALEPRDSPSWSPDGKWVAVAANAGHGVRLYRVSVDSGEAITLTEGRSRLPVWSPDGRFIVYSEERQGPGYPVKAVTPEGRPYPLPTLSVLRGLDRYRLLAGGSEMVVLEMEGGKPDFWSINLRTGQRRRLTDLKQGYSISSFDLSPDGKQILFDRIRENADVVLIDLPK
jgi:serine/threonine protein kinase